MQTTEDIAHTTEKENLLRRLNGFTTGATALVLAAAASLAGVPAASAATVAPPSGFVFCNIVEPDSTITSTPPLTAAPSTKVVRMVLTGTATCDSSQVVNGKGPITDASFRFTWVAAKGSTCSSLPSGTPVKAQKLQLTLKGKNERNRPFTVATVRGTQTEVRTFYNGFTNVGYAQAGNRKAFSGEQVILNSYVSPEALADQCAGAGVASLPFGGNLYVRYEQRG